MNDQYFVAYMIKRYFMQWLIIIIVNIWVLFIVEKAVQVEYLLANTYAVDPCVCCGRFWLSPKSLPTRGSILVYLPIAIGITSPSLFELLFEGLLNTYSSLSRTKRFLSFSRHTRTSTYDQLPFCSCGSSWFAAEGMLGSFWFVLRVSLWLKHIHLIFMILRSNFKKYVSSICKKEKTHFQLLLFKWKTEHWMS